MSEKRILVDWEAIPPNWREEYHKKGYAILGQEIDDETGMVSWCQPDKWCNIPDMLDVDNETMVVTAVFS